MRPVTHTLIDKVRAPMELVFALLTDPARMPQWLPGCSGAQASGPVKKGARIKPQFGARESEFEVVDFAPPRTFGWTERGQRRGSKTFFRLDKSGDATSITVQATASVSVETASVSIDATSIGLGSGAAHPLVLGDLFMALFNAHGHTTTIPGTPTSPPLTPMLPPMVSMVTRTT